LGQMGAAAVPRLVDKMKTQDAREMQTLEDVFKHISHPAVPYLVDALGSTDNYRRRLSARILGEMADSGAVDGLLSYTNDSDFRLRAGVVAALGKIGNSRGVAPARLALADNDYLVRTSAAIALSNLKDSTTILPLMKALSDPYYGVRYPASQAIANIGKAAVPFIMESLSRSGDTLAYYLSIEISGNLVDNRFTPKLDKIANSDDPYARSFAIEALGKIGTPEAMNIIRKRYDIELHPLVIAKIESIVLK